MLIPIPQEILFLIIKYLGRSQMLASRLVNQTWNNIATEILNRIRAHVQFRTTMCVKYFVSLMTDSSQPRIYTKFQFKFKNISLECIQQFASEIGPQAIEYTLEKPSSSMQILTLLHSSPNLEVITLEGISFSKTDILSYACSLPKYLHLRVIKCKRKNDDFCELLKLVVNKAPRLKLIFLDFGGKTSAQSLEIIKLLPPTTKINLCLKHGIAEETSSESIISLSKATTNIQNLHINTSFTFTGGRELLQPVSALLKSQSEALKYLEISSYLPYSIPLLRQLKWLRLTPRENWDVEALIPENFPNLSELKLYKPCTLPMFRTGKWPNVTTLQLCSWEPNITTFLSEDLSSVFMNLRKLELKSTYSLENDLKCCFRRFMQLEELSLDFLDYEDIPNLWDCITGGATYAEDVETFPFYRDYSLCAKDATLENLNLKKLTIKSCRPNTLNAIMHVSFGGNFKLQRLELVCHKDCNLKALQGAIMENLSKYHKSVIIK